MSSERMRTLKAELLADMLVLEELEDKYRLIHAKLERIGLIGDGFLFVIGDGFLFKL